MKYIKYFLLICLFGCGSHYANKNILNLDSLHDKKKNTIVGNLQNESKYFQEFWNNFRETVLDSDSDKLILFVHFPLLIHGDLEEDPQLKINKVDFFSFFKKFLERTILIRNENYTNYEFIKKTQIAKMSFVYQETETWNRVGDLEFELINNNWKLTLLYYPYEK